MINSNNKPSKKSNIAFFIGMVFVIAVIAMTSFVFVDDKYKGDVINQLTNKSIMI